MNLVREYFYQNSKVSMRYLSKTKKIKMLSRLYWDMDVKPEQLYRMLDGEADGIGYIDRMRIIGMSREKYFELLQKV